MKEYFAIILFVVAVSFFSARVVFEKKRGFFRFAGLEIYILGVILSFVFSGQDFFTSLCPLFILALAFAGFGFGIQFEKGILKEIRAKSFLYGFLASLNFFILFFVLHFFYPMNMAIPLSAIFSIPSSSILFSIKKGKRPVIAGELSIVLILIYYTVAMYGFKGVLLSVVFGLAGFLIIPFERILKKMEAYILALGFLLLVASLSQMFNTSIILSAFFMGFVVAFFSKPRYSSAMVGRIEQPLFLSLLFSSGLFFQLGSIVIFAFLIAYIPIRFFFTFLLFKRKSIFFIPIGALGIALSIETKVPYIITFTAISYFILLVVFEFIYRGEKWYT